MSTRKFKMIVAYDGARYAGWQTQKIGLGVQQVIEEALAKFLPVQPRLHGSSRTDTGVHALGMVAHFEVPRDAVRLPPAKMRLALNAHLPEDIRVSEVRACSADFHARFHARGKQYRYFVWNHPAMNPLLRHTAWHVPQTLALPEMRAAAACFTGRQDFRSFAANRNYEMPSTVRNVTRCQVQKRGPLLTFLIEADGFLYKMCRGIVGTVVQVGLGRFTAEDIRHMLRERDRRVAGMNAPAHGLVLWKVFYPKRGEPPPKAPQD